MKISTNNHPWRFGQLVIILPCFSNLNMKPDLYRSLPFKYNLWRLPSGKSKALCKSRLLLGFLIQQEMLDG